MSSSDSTECAMPGRRLANRYFVESIVGQGSFGRVFRARDESSREEVALKEFVRQPGKGDSFLRELGLLFELKHPNIIDCRSLVMAGSYRYIVCEYMECGSLRDMLERPYSIRDALEVYRQALAGVVFAHSHDIIHRDLKPENILLSRGEGGRELVAKVSDFGVSTIGTSLLSRSCIGSPAYMAPEQFYEQYDGRVDVYALGILLYEILCGRRPYYGSPAQLMACHIRREPEYPLWLPKSVVRLLRKALAKRVDRRFRSVEELSRSFDTVLSLEGSVLEREGFPDQVTDVRELAAARDEVLVRRDGEVLRFDRRGRILEAIAGATSIVAAESFHAIRCGESVMLHGPAGTKRHGQVPEHAALALSLEGTLAFLHEGHVTIIDSAGRHQLALGNVTAAAFVGEEQTLGLARTDGGVTSLEFGGARVELPEAVSEVFGHGNRYELIARSALDPNRLFLVRLGRVTPLSIACKGFSCDGNAFYSVTPEGELVTIQVRNGGVARTRWTTGLSAVAANQDRVVWSTVDGRLVQLGQAG